MFLMQNPTQPLVRTKWITSLFSECLGGREGGREGERKGGEKGGKDNQGKHTCMYIHVQSLVLHHSLFLQLRANFPINL